MGWPQPSFMPESMKVRSYEIDVAIVDIRLPPTHGDEGLQAALQIRAEPPHVGVLVLSQ
jgi:DNA-binding NarL/FixJ family response regulator